MSETKIKKRRTYAFPENFLWGVATSSHQVEGNNENDWTEWEKIEGHIKDGSISGRACNSYEWYEDDIRLVKELNNTAYRFSLEWSRIEPVEGQFDNEAIEHYRKIIKTCKKNNIEPIVTLNHWTVPLWFRDQRGWLNKDAPVFFRRYTQQVVKKLGHEINYWCTINEPMIYAFNCYLKGKWPPQKKSYFKFKKVLKNLVSAHVFAYNVIHDNYPQAKVSIAKNNQYFEAYVDNWLNRRAVNFLRNFWNHWFLKKIKDKLDYIGLNYYFHNAIFVSWNGYVNMNENKKTTDMGWEIYPAGLYHVLLELKKYRLPVIILENGLADKKDKYRADFIKDHLRNVHKAYKAGVEIHGYCHWSLLDNFEWSDGFGPKFGLYNVDLKTFARTPRPSAQVYAEIARNNGF
ncbi:MAG: glycoside hydrolase family 1 protein [bacterium]|nr:glycoside hydrolase family 1 protein [bacterium]